MTFFKNGFFFYEQCERLLRIPSIARARRNQMRATLARIKTEKRAQAHKESQKPLGLVEIKHEVSLILQFEINLGLQAFTVVAHVCGILVLLLVLFETVA